MPRSVLSLANMHLMCFGLGFIVLADEVRLKNGDRLTGAIVKADGKTLTLKTDYAGAVTIAADAIAEVISQEPLYVALNSIGVTFTNFNFRK